jgi:hypothetical protein
MTDAAGRETRAGRYDDQCPTAALCRLLLLCVIEDGLAHLNLPRRSWRHLVRFVAMKRVVAVVIAAQQGAS